MRGPMVLASGEYNVLAPIPHEMVVGTVLFAVLFLVLSKVVLPKLDAIYSERHDRIDGMLERAAQARAEARRADDEYRARIGEAREEASRIRDTAREEGRRSSEEVLASAREEAAGIVGSGRAELDEERSRLRTDLQPDIARLSRDLAGRILGRTVGEDEHRETVDGYLAQRT